MPTANIVKAYEMCKDLFGQANNVLQIAAKTHRIKMQAAVLRSITYHIASFKLTIKYRLGLPPYWWEESKSTKF